MRKTFKGFTLVECLVALAILAIACMMLGAIEATVASRNNFNHFNNTSLANQMAYIEKYENVQTVKIAYTDPATPTTTPPSGTNSGTTAYVKITKLKSDGTADDDSTYSFPVDIYVMYSRDTGNDASTTVTEDAVGNRTETANTNYSQMYSEQNDNLRYKYVLGHTS